ncbi:hypothetical protein NQZ68_007704 [Dissostichus eleginoides]|nr:hypothetical protein NQZ68_007704 [Dissostichus eleginoides]
MRPRSTNTHSLTPTKGSLFLPTNPEGVVKGDEGKGGGGGKCNLDCATETLQSAKSSMRTEPVFPFMQPES